MKKVLLLLGLLSWLFAAELEVTVEGVANDSGTIVIGLYNQAEKFRDVSSTFKQVKLKAHKGELHARFEELPKGRYAVSVLHDANDNDQLDSNFFGVPTEGYGFSNNVHFALRPATFDEAAFELKEAKTLVIEMHN